MFLTRVLVVFLVLAGVPAHAMNPEVANCDDLKDPATQAQVEICNNHPGCSLVLKFQKTCATANEFLSKLKVASSGRKVITSSDVFEAAAPPVTNDPEFIKASQAIKSRFDRQAGNVISSGVNESKSITWVFKGPWVYEGPMVNGQRHGVGVIIDGEGRLFRGEFVAGRQVGKGEYTDTGKSKRRDVGDSQGFDLNGNGIRRTPRVRFIGQFKADRPDGRVTTVRDDGYRHEGERVKGNRHGPGTEIYPNGGRYVGGFVDDKKHGQGTETFPNGQRYEGEFANGKRHGQGTYAFPSGERYVGEFANGNYHGQGTLTFPSGARYVGSHVDDKRFNGRLTNANGNVLEVYIDGNKQGSGATPGNVAQQAANDQQQAAAEQERKEARRRDRREAWAILKPVVGDAASRNPDKARRLATAEALATKPTEGGNRVSTALNLYADNLTRKNPGAAGSSPGANGIGEACTTQNKQFRKEEGRDFMFYSPFDCISVEWRAKPERTYSNETGRQGRIINRCACGVTFRTNGGDSIGGDAHQSSTAKPGVGRWQSELKGRKPLEVVPNTSCHYTDAIQAIYVVKLGMCRAMKCLNSSAYAACGYHSAR